MSDIDPDYRDLIVEGARAIVSQAAPEELDIFDELAEEYLADPTPPDLSATAPDNPLGMGAGEILVALTKAALAVMAVVVPFAEQVAVDAFTDASTTFIKDRIVEWLEALRRKDKQAAAKLIMPGSPEAQQLRALARYEAKRYGMSDEEEQRMAVALFGGTY